jgi:hypothetical protein
MRPAVFGCSANGATEANYVSVRVGYGALPLAILLVTRAVHFNPRLPPLLGHAVGIVTVDVENTVTRKFVSASLGKVDGEISIPVSKGVGVVVDRHLEARPFEPRRRTSHICNLEDRLESRDQPLSRYELELAVSLPIQTGQAVVTDRQVGVRPQSDPPID